MVIRYEKRLVRRRMQNPFFARGDGADSRIQYTVDSIHSYRPRTHDRTRIVNS